jgi:GAF domain-containing protein
LSPVDTGQRRCATFYRSLAKETKDANRFTHASVDAEQTRATHMTSRMTSHTTPSPLDEALHALTQFVLSDADLAATLEKVAVLTKKAVPPAAVVGYSLLDSKGNPSTPIYTDERSPRIDQAQYEDGKGPCLDSGRTRQRIRIDDVTRAEVQYPEFCAVAKAEGVFSTLSLPLVVSDNGIGALNLYAERALAFSQDDESVAATLATAISVLLANVTEYWNARSMSEHLTEAMKSRAVIEQAKGVLMAQRRELGPDDAFDLLRRASQRENRKLRDIAQSIVDRNAGMSTDPDS